MADLPRVLTTADLRPLRVSNGVAERQVRAGAWRRGAPGVLLTDAAGPTAQDLADIAKAYLCEEFLLTGLLVLHELGLPWLPPLERGHALVPADVRRRGGDLLRVTRTTDYDALLAWRRYGARLAVRRARLWTRRGLSPPCATSERWCSVRPRGE